MMTSFLVAMTVMRITKFYFIFGGSCISAVLACNGNIITQVFRSNL